MGFKKIDLEQQYALFLERMDLDESKMHPQQKIQIKQTFFGAYGQALLALRDNVATQEENAAVETVKDILNQVQNFFLTELKRQN